MKGFAGLTAYKAIIPEKVLRIAAIFRNSVIAA
jgi:hypothetical protein